MAGSKIFVAFLQACLIIAVLAAPSPSEQSCKVDGKIYKEYEQFATGVDECATCYCTDDLVQCNAIKCQEMVSHQNKQRAIDDSIDYANIKNQLAKQYFTDFDPARLKVITDTLGCKSADCPQLLSASSIDYNIVALNRQEYVGRADKQNKIVVHSTDAEVVNNSPTRQEVNTVSYSIKVTQYFEVTVTKTTFISSSASITLKFLKLGAEFQFTKNTSQTQKTSNETTLDAPSQKVIVDPYTKMNVTFNFYQYEDINNYFLDFEIAPNSTISHPDVDATSNVIFVKKPMGDFLQKPSTIDFLPTMKYENDTMIKIESRDETFVLRNIPATEKITNFGVDVVFGKPEEIPH